MDWRGERHREDARWKYDTLPSGTAGVVLANGSMSSTRSGEGDIRRAMIEGELVDCMIALPGQLFHSTRIPACLWFLARDKSNAIARDRKLRAPSNAIGSREWTNAPEKDLLAGERHRIKRTARGSLAERKRMIDPTAKPGVSRGGAVWRRMPGCHALTSGAGTPDPSGLRRPA